MKNAYAARLAAERQTLADVSVQVAESIIRQYSFDILCLALHDIYGFGAARLERLNDAMGALWAEYAGVFQIKGTETSEEELVRAKLDERLHEIFKSEGHDFYTRYPVIRRPSYEKRH